MVCRIGEGSLGGFWVEHLLDHPRDKPRPRSLRDKVRHFRVRSLDRVSLERVDDVLRGMTSVQLFAKNSRGLLSCRPRWPPSEAS